MTLQSGIKSASAPDQSKELSSIREQLRQTTQACHQAEKKLLALYRYMGLTNRRLALLHNINNLPSKFKKPKNIANNLAKLTRELSGAKISILYQYDPKANEFLPLASSGTKTKSPKIIFDPSNKLVAKLIRKKCRIQANCEDFCLNLEENSVKKNNKILVLALELKNDLLGALFLIFQPKKNITTQELTIFDVMAFQSSFALREMTAAAQDRKPPRA